MRIEVRHRWRQYNVSLNKRLVPKGIGMIPAVKIICSECGAEAEPLDWRCHVCGGPLELAEPIRFRAEAIDEGEFSLWRYAAMLPVERRFTLGEGLTPLVATSMDGLRVYVKLEYLNPTGSYKDRGTTTMMNHLLAHDVQAVVEDSSGNAGASVAAYSTASGVYARIFVPQTAAAGKKSLITRFGGELIEVAGVSEPEARLLRVAGRLVGDLAARRRAVSRR